MSTETTLRATEKKNTIKTSKKWKENHLPWYLKRQTEDVAFKMS